MILKRIGYNVKTIVIELKEVFKSSATAIAGFLKDAGYGLVTIANAIKDIFDSGFSFLKTLLFALTKVIIMALYTTCTPTTEST